MDRFHLRAELTRRGKQAVDACLCAGGTYKACQGDCRRRIPAAGNRTKFQNISSRAGDILTLQKNKYAKRPRLRAVIHDAAPAKRDARGKGTRPGRPSRSEPLRVHGRGRKAGATEPASREGETRRLRFHPECQRQENPALAGPPILPRRCGWPPPAHRRPWPPESSGACL